MLALFPRTNASCRALMARWLVAFCRASKWYIREDEPLEEELTAWLEPHELKQLVSRWLAWQSVHSDVGVIDRLLCCYH